MEIDGKTIALIRANNEYFEYCSKIHREFGCSLPSGALLAAAEFQLRYKITAITSAPKEMFNEDGTINKRKLDSKRRKYSINGDMLVETNLKGESK